MKILLYYDYLTEIGGVERVMATHARWLQEVGHDVTLIFDVVDKKILDYKFLQGLNIQEFSSLKSKNESLKIMATFIGIHKLKQYKPDLIICYSFISLYVSRVVKCKKAFYYLPMEFIYFSLKERWEWANDSKRKIAFFGSFFVAPILKVMDKIWIKNKLVIANSDFTKTEIKDRYGVDAIISYPPLNSIFKSKPKGECRETLDKFRLKKDFILTSGRIIPDKKTDWLIEVFSKIKRDFDFLIVGGIIDEHKSYLLDTAEKYGVQEKVKVLGLVDQSDLIDLYSAAKVFVFASPKEAFGLVPIEAMACGTPAVAWDDGAGPSEYVVDGVNGFLAHPYDLVDFHSKVENILGSDFKEHNKDKIIDSVNKFLDKEQAIHFINNIENFCKKD